MRIVNSVAMIAVLAFSASASAHQMKYKSLTIVHPWTAATVPAAQPAPAHATVHMKIRNTGKVADRLLRASSPRAAAVELRDEGDGGGPAIASLAVPPGGELRPRLLLIGVGKPFHAYDRFPMTLVFEKAGKLEIDVTVEDAAEEGPGKPG